MKTKIFIFIISLVCSFGAVYGYTPTQADWGREVYSMYMELSDGVHFMLVDLEDCKMNGGCEYRRKEFKRRYLDLVDLSYKLGDYCQMFLGVASVRECKAKAEYYSSF